MPTIPVRPATQFLIPTIPTGGVVTDTILNRLRDTMSNLHSRGYVAATGQGQYINGRLSPFLGYTTGQATVGAKTSQQAQMMLPSGYDRFTLIFNSENTVFLIEAWIVKGQSRHLLWSDDRRGIGGASTLTRVMIDDVLPFVATPNTIDVAYVEFSITPVDSSIGQTGNLVGTIGIRSFTLTLYRSDAC